MTEKKKKEKIEYYDITNARKTNSQYYLLLGQRSNGKSYQVKNIIALQDAWDYINGRMETSRFCDKGKTRPTGKFIYLRRWQTDIKAGAVRDYFGDCKKFIKKLTEGRFDRVEAYAGVLYFAGLDDEGNLVKSEEIGRYHALNLAEHYKSRAFVDFVNIIYEEFITDGIYLVDEPSKLQQYVSTICRLEAVSVFLIGNTLSRVCPYFSEWCLEGVLKQKQGTIEIYHFHVPQKDESEVIINICVEYCANANVQNKMFFGQTAKQIVSGEWDTKDVPKLPRKQEEYEKVYEILVVYQSFKFVIELLVEPVEGGRICFVYPYTGRRKIERVITDEFSDSLFKSSKLDLKRIPEAFIDECFRVNKVCYSDNLTGADFKTVNAQLGIGKFFY